MTACARTLESVREREGPAPMPCSPTTVRRFLGWAAQYRVSRTGDRTPFMSVPDDLLRASFQTLVPHLRTFVRAHLEAKYGPEFQQRLSRTGERPFSDRDPRALIKASLAEWEQAFRDNTPSQVKQYLHMLRDVANRHAHHETFNADEVDHALRTIRLLALAIGGSHAALELDRLISRSPASPTEARSQVPRSSKRQAPRSDGALDPDLLDADSAVNQAVLCPACRSKVFKVWPLGWDAHAAFACKGLPPGVPESRKRDFRARFARLFR